MAVDTFAVTEDFQAKTLAFMLHNQEFCSIAADSLSVEQFSNKALQWFYGRVSNKALSPVTLQEEMITAARSKEIRKEDIQKYVGFYDVIRQPPLPVEQEYISDKLGTFIRTQAVKQVAMEMLSRGGLVEQERWEEIEEKMRAATQAGFQLQNLGISYFTDVAQRVQDRAGRRAARRIATGIPELDSLTYGGIKNKQTGIIIGGTGRGKSIFLQWLARTAILLGKKVLYITMELSEEDLADRFDSMFAKVRPQELNDYQKEVTRVVGNLGTTYGDALRIKHFPVNTATVGTFKAFTRQLSNIGLAPDLILLDYLDLIKPHQHYNTRTDEQIAVVQAVVGFGQEFDLSIWTALQLNRGGLIMETPDESAQAGSIERQFIADMVFWLAQTKDERQDEIMRIISSKNRNGRTGWSISLDTDYAYMAFCREQPEVQNDDGSGSSGGSEEKTGATGEEQEADAGVEEKRDLQRMFLKSEEEHATLQEQPDREECVSEVSSSTQHERGQTDDSEGGDPVPEV
jgi:replicative DNA helicase